MEGIISFWLGECALVGNRFAKRFGLKHFCFLLGQDAKASNRFVPLIRPHSGMLIALSDFLAEEFFKSYKVQPGHIIPTGIDLRWFNERAEIRDIDVLGVGSLIPLKQFDLWVRVIKELVRVKPRLKAVLIGKGPEMGVLADLTKQLGLSENIQFTGELSHNKVLLHMQRSKLLLHPSSYEGFSTVVMESLYAGCPVVTFCKPMRRSFKNFYVVENKEQMLQKAIEVFSEGDHTSVATYFVQEGVAQVMGLFTSTN